MPVVQDARAGRRRRRLGAAAIAAIIVVTQAAAVALAAPPGTSLTAAKTTAGHLVQTFPWTLSKEVAPSSLTLSSGESDSVTYTVGATKGNAVQSAYFDGEICVTNTGAVATQGLTIIDRITKPPSKSVLESVSVSVSAHPVLQPGETFCYPYRVDIYTGVTPGATYKDTASVTITNKAGKGSGPSPSSTTALPTTVEVTNNDSITVDDTNGSSFTFPATGTQSYDKTFTCPDDDGSQTNTVSATGFVSTPSVPEPAPARATVVVTCLEPDVTVSKTDELTNATLEDTITYAMSVRNIGLGMAHGVMLSDSLPAGITWSIDNMTDFALSGNSLTLKNQPIDLAAGATLAVNVSGTVTQGVCETTLTNSATVSATNEDAGDTGNNSAIDTTAIGCVQLEVTKTADAALVSAGDPVGYTITVSNSGAGDASGVTLTDTLPANAGLSWTIVPPDADCSISTGTLTCDFETILSGGSALVHISSPTTPETCGTISNEATATTTSASGTPTSGPVTITVNCPDVTVEKTADTSPISAGDTATFAIEVTNAGDGAAYTVSISDSLPTGITWLDDSDDCSIDAGVLTCAFGDLAPTGSASVHVTGTTAAADCGTLSNTATAAATNEATADLGNNSSTATIDVLCPAIAVTKVADDDSVSAGDQIGYEITVSNTGAGTASNVTLSDTLAFTGGVNWSLDGGSGVADCSLTPAAPSTNQVLSCSFGNLGPVESRSVRVVSPTFAVCSVVQNAATASANGIPPVTSDPATITINCPNVTVLKTAGESSISAGDTASFTIVVSNPGAGTARSVMLTDTLPADVSWTDDSADCDVIAGVLGCAFGDLATGGSATVNVSGATDADDCGILSNTVSVSATNEAAANEDDNSSTASITVNCAVIEISKDADAATVQAGAAIGFLITVTNTGDGTARDVTVSDTVPTDAGTSWSIDGGTGQALCSIDSGVLGCAFGDLASGASVTVHVSSPTTTDTCPDSPVDNLASVTTTNDGSAQAQASVTVRCNTAPVADDQTATTAEDTPVTITLTASDADSDPLTFAVESLPATGTLEACSDSLCTTASAITTGAPLPNPYVRYTPPADVNGTGLASFTFTANDGFVDSNTATITIDVTAENDAPVVTTTAGSLAYTENDPATAIDAGLTVTDVDSTTLTGATVQITTGCDFSQDVLALASPPAGITAVYTAASCTLALTGGASLADYQAALRAVTYTNTSDNPSTAARTVTFTADDGLATGADTRGIAVTAVNDAPVNTVPGGQSVDEDTDLTFSGSLSVADVDAGTGAVQVVVSVLNGTITPASGSGATILGSGTSSATITGTLAQVNGALNGLKYRGNLNYNSTRGSETLTITTDDQGNTGTGGPLTDTDTVAITVNAVNDAPSAVAKNYNAQANMKITGLTGLLTGATDPDTGDGGYTAVFTVGTVSATTPAGGTISNLDAANGTFDFDPPSGATGNVTFTYAVCDSGNPAPSACSAPATVTVSVAGPVIWFVNPAAGINGDGRLSSPFDNLASAAAVDASGHRIFLYSGTATTGITLNTNEWLIGQGVTGSTFDSLFSITPPAGTVARPSINGTRPIVQGNVVMATGDAVRGLNIQPASGTAGLTASGATSLTVGEVSVTTATAAAVNLSSSGGTISLTSVSANGGSNGIVLNGTTGTFTVTGTTGTCTEANTSGCSGGVIQNMTGSDDSTATPVGTGIVLNNAAGVSLTRMYIHDHTNYGIRGTSVAGFALDTSVVNGVNGNNVVSPFSDGSISFDNLSGTSAITNSAISGGYQRNIRVDNTTGTLTLTINNNSIHNTGNTAGDDGLFVEIGGGTATLTVTNNTFSAHGGDHFNLSVLGTPTVGLTFTGNSGNPGNPLHPIGLGQGFFILGASFDGAFTYNVSNNTVYGTRQGGAIHVNKGSGSGTFSGRIENNTVGVSGQAESGASESSGILVASRGTGSHTSLVNGNTIQQYDEMGINIDGGEGGITTLNVTVTNNLIREPGLNALHGVHLNWGVISTGNGSTACVDIRDNDASAGGNETGGGFDYRLRQRNVTTILLPGYAGANNDNTAVQSFILGQNTGVDTALASNNVAGGGGGFVGGAACAQP